jgi:hypothetical protein
MPDAGYRMPDAGYWMLDIRTNSPEAARFPYPVSSIHYPASA